MCLMTAWPPLLQVFVVVVGDSFVVTSFRPVTRELELGTSKSLIFWSPWLKVVSLQRFSAEKWRVRKRNVKFFLFCVADLQCRRRGIAKLRLLGWATRNSSQLWKNGGWSMIVKILLWPWEESSPLLFTGHTNWKLETWLTLTVLCSEHFESQKAELCGYMVFLVGF